MAISSAARSCLAQPVAGAIAMPMEGALVCMHMQGASAAQAWPWMGDSMHSPAAAIVLPYAAGAASAAAAAADNGRAARKASTAATSRACIPETPVSTCPCALHPTCPRKALGTKHTSFTQARQPGGTFSKGCKSGRAWRSRGQGLSSRMPAARRTSGACARASSAVTRSACMAHAAMDQNGSPSDYTAGEAQASKACLFYV